MNPHSEYNMRAWYMLSKTILTVHVCAATAISIAAVNVVNTSTQASLPQARQRLTRSSILPLSVTPLMTTSFWTAFLDWSVWSFCGVVTFVFGLNIGALSFTTYNFTKFGISIYNAIANRQQAAVAAKV